MPNVTGVLTTLYVLRNINVILLYTLQIKRSAALKRPVVDILFHIGTRFYMKVLHLYKGYKLSRYCFSFHQLSGLLVQLSMLRGDLTKTSIKRTCCIDLVTPQHSSSSSCTKSDLMPLLATHYHCPTNCNLI